MYSDCDCDLLLFHQKSSLLLIFHFLDTYGDQIGQTGSTHVYNGIIGRVDGSSGKLYIQNFFSRKAQMDENGTSNSFPFHNAV